MGNLQLDSLDKKILETLSQNARKPYLEIARECNVSGAAITCHMVCHHRDNSSMYERN